MAVAFDASSESHTGTTGSTSQASFTWNHVGGASARGALVFVFSALSATHYVTGVTYGGVAMTAVPYDASVNSAEPYACRAYYLDNCGGGTKAVVVNRTNNTIIMYAVCFTVLAGTGKATEVYNAGVMTQGGATSNTGASSSGNTSTATAGLKAVDDGSPGTNSLRFMGQGYGGSSVLAAGTGSTAGPSIDFGAYVIDTFYESAAGQGARDVGSAAGTDDLCVVALAVREKLPIAGSFTGDANVSATRSGTASETTIVPDVPAATEYLGTRVAISRDGTTVVSEIPSEYKIVIKKAGNSAVYKTISGLASTSPTPISISDDGSVIVVGNPSYNSSRGRVSVFSGVNWVTETIIEDPAATVIDYFGRQVWVSGDGLTLVVNSTSEGADHRGATRVFTGTNWATVSAVLTPATVGNGAAGVNNLSVSKDGSVIAVGDATYPNGGTSRGRVVVYSGSSWGTTTQVVQASPVDSDNFGATLYISEDGTTIVTSYFTANKAWVLSGTGWGTVTPLVPSDLVAGQGFGVSSVIAADGSKVAIGSYTKTNGGTARGEVYVFSGTNWATETGLYQPSPTDYDWFGFSLAANSDLSVIAAGMGGSTNARGAVLVLSGASWANTYMYGPGVLASQYGYCVALVPTSTALSWTLAVGVRSATVSGYAGAGTVLVETYSAFGFTGDATIYRASSKGPFSFTGDAQVTGGAVTDAPMPYVGGGYYS